MVEHCVSSTQKKYWQCKCRAWMHCKSLWIKVSAKCINVNVNFCSRPTLLAFTHAICQDERWTGDVSVIYILLSTGNMSEALSGGETTDDSSLMLKCYCQSTIVGGASVRVTAHGQTARFRFEKGVKILVEKKQKKHTGWIFIIIGWFCTHTANTHSSANNL